MQLRNIKITFDKLFEKKNRHVIYYIAKIILARKYFHKKAPS